MCCLCHGICKWLDVPFHSDKDDKPKAPSLVSSLYWLAGDVKAPSLVSSLYWLAGDVKKPHVLFAKRGNLASGVVIWP